MIEVTGIAGTPEHAAGVYLGEQLARLWPGLAQSPASREKVCIAANAKISGYGVGDVDIVVAASFTSGDRNFLPRRAVPVRHAGVTEQRPVNVHNLIVAIEVKDHDASAVRYAGDSVEVLYTRRGRQEWKGATEQNIAQLHALADYFRDFLGDRPFVHRCLVMQGLQRVALNGVLSAGFDGADFLTALAATSGVHRGPHGPVLDSMSGTLPARKAIGAPIFTVVRPTALDRRRMDAIASDAREASRIDAYLGRKMIRLRGTGGTGKTVMLLHAAWKAFRERGSRTLLLTYNLALVADIRRTLTLMGVPSSPEEGGIKVQAVMSFMISWFRRLGTVGDGQPDLDEYDANCIAALDMIHQGAVTPEDILRTKSERPELYEFDAIVVDEAQDSPQFEADLLKVLYDPRQILLADGIDQLVRRSAATDWQRGVPEESRLLIALSECLRMKRNLALFLNVAMEVGGLSARVRPNESAGGGRIIILRRPYREYPDLHQQLIQGARAAGNSEVDILHCVPWSRASGRGDLVRGRTAIELREMGSAIWDGTDPEVRQEFPRSASEYRLVRYDSCRGLEGWVVVLHDADIYFSDCQRHRENLGLTEEESHAYANISQVARAYAWRRMLIAMTRPIDTLVMSLGDAEPDFASVVIRASARCRDFVDIRD